MPVAEVSLGSIGPMTQLGSGGQGKVFDVPDLKVPGETGPFVYKQYKGKVILGHESAIKNGMGRLVAVRATDPRMTAFMDRISIWPLAVVLPAPGSPGACGIVMRKFPRTCRYPIRLPAQTKTVDFTVSQYFRTGADVIKVGLPAMGDEDRWMFLLRAAMFMQKLHSRDVIFGDLSGNNVVVNYDQGRRGKIFLPMFIDTDGCRIRGEQAAFRQLNTPGWEPPEIRSALTHYTKKKRDPTADSNSLHRAETRCYHLSMATDVYKFGLLIQRFLHKGIASPQDLPITAGPSNVRMSQEAARVVNRVCGPKRASVIRRSQQANPKNRPTMTELLEAMMGQPIAGPSR